MGCEARVAPHPRTALSRHGLFPADLCIESEKIRRFESQPNIGLADPLVSRRWPSWPEFFCPLEYIWRWCSSLRHGELCERVLLRRRPTHPLAHGVMKKNLFESIFVRAHSVVRFARFVRFALFDKGLRSYRNRWRAEFPLFSEVREKWKYRIGLRR